MSVVRQPAQGVLQEVMVEVTLPVACQQHKRVKARSWPPRRGRLVIDRLRWQRQLQRQLRQQRGVDTQVP